MTINWFTVAAQILNFLVLVWLMKRFLYKPVLAAIQEREQKIQAQLKDAETNKAEAIKQQEDFRLKNEMFDKERKGLVENMLKDVKIEKDKLEEEAKNEVSVQKANQINSLKDSQLKSFGEIKRKTQKEVFAMTRKTLSDLASTTLEDQVVNQFLQKMQSDDQVIKKFQPSSEPVTIQSAFELNPDQQNKIKSVLGKMIGEQTDFQFKTFPDMITGIEVSLSGYKLSWSISDYLDSMENSNANGSQQIITA